MSAEKHETILLDFPQSNPHPHLVARAPPLICRYRRLPQTQGRCQGKLTLPRMKERRARAREAGRVYFVAPSFAFEDLSACVSSGECSLVLPSSLSLSLSLSCALFSVARSLPLSVAPHQHTASSSFPRSPPLQKFVLIVSPKRRAVLADHVCTKVGQEN